jgi:hypothetical protein
MQRASNALQISNKTERGTPGYMGEGKGTERSWLWKLRSSTDQLGGGPLIVVWREVRLLAPDSLITVRSTC